MSNRQAPPHHDREFTEASRVPVPPTDGEEGRRRALLYSHDGFGLGHLRRTLTIARALAERNRDVALLTVTSSLHGPTYEAIANLDYIKLPAVGKRHLYEGLPARGGRRGTLRNVWYVREALLDEAANAFAPHLVVVDQAPAGLAGEAIRALTSLDGARPRPTLVLVLRDITYGPDETRAIWEREGVHDLLDHVYDHILICGSREIFDPIHEYGFSATAAAKSVFCGYITRAEPMLPAKRLKERLGATTAPLVVVAAGGGADGGALLRTYISALRMAKPGGLVSLVVTGPYLQQPERSELETAVRDLPGVTVTSFTRHFLSYLNAADVVVTMGGYNTVCEAVSLGKRPIVVPRVVGSQEQLIRAERFAERDLVTMLHPDDLTPERLWRVVEAELNRRAAPPSMLDVDGLRRVGDILADALARPASLTRSQPVGEELA